jgi:hypothetical protein
MPIDSSIALGYKTPQFESPVNSLAQVLQVQQAQGANNLQQYTLNKAQRTDNETNSLAQMIASPGFDLRNPADQARAFSVAPTVAGTYIKSMLDNSNTQAQTRERNSTAGFKDTEAAQKRTDLIGQGYGAVMQNPTPNTANQVIDNFVSNGLLTPDQAAQHKATIAANPAPEQISQLAQTLFRGAVPAKDQLMKTESRNIGGSTQTMGIDPVTGKTQVLNSVQNTQAPDNAATVGATMRGQDLTNARGLSQLDVERTKADPFGVLGLNKNAALGSGPQSTLTGDQYLATLPQSVATQVKMMAEGKIPITAMALRSPQVTQLLTMAAQYEPNTDATTYLGRAATVKSFAPGGVNGQKITNANQALHHAGQLSDAIDSLDNGNILPGVVNPLINSAQQTLLGDPRQGIFTQKADALSSELRKLFAGGGGGNLTELKNWQDSLGPNASKQQQQAYLKSGMELLTGAIQSQQDSYERGMGPQANFGALLSPESKTVLSRLAPDYAAKLATSGPQPNAQPAGQPPTVNTKSDYDRLPSGTSFIAPDGQNRRKP